MVRLAKKFIRTFGRYTVYSVSASVLAGYDGMNFYAARELGFKPRPKRNEIFISSASRNVYRTLRHEVTEIRLMRDRRWSYWRAHMRAFRKERKGR
mgnify:CR=1 FL=1